jgi:hypothetical protein
MKEIDYSFLFDLLPRNKSKDFNDIICDNNYDDNSHQNDDSHNENPNDIHVYTQ